MELLAPAGGMEQLKAALRFGADAVYAGMKGFGLRAFADNFDQGRLGEAVALTHAYGKHFYVTLNVLPLDRDLPGLRETIAKEYAEWKSNPVASADFMTKRMNRPQSDTEVAVTVWENITATNRELPDMTGW